MVGRKQTGYVKKSIGNVEAKELICMTHGHDLKWGNVGGEVDGGEWGKRSRE